MPIDFTDYMSLWCLVCEHERDPAFVLSLELVRPGSTVCDVGANIGIWTLPAAALVGPDGSVHAFEPVPSTFAALAEHVRLNRLGNVRCNQIALSERTDVRTIWAASEGNTGASGFVARTAATEAIPTQSMTLDEYCDAEGIDSIDVLKVDVEGAELLVLRGASSRLSADSAPVIVFEVDANLMAELGWDLGKVLALLSAHGYSVYRQYGPTLAPFGQGGETLAHGDLLALKPFHFERYSALRERLAES
jgi:FkbM family methyltransferase